MTKRILSALIAVSMLIPAFTISNAQTSEDTLLYDLTHRTAGWTSTSVVDMKYEHTGDGTADGNWAYYAKDTSTWVRAVADLLTDTDLKKRIRVWPNAKGQWVAFKIKIPSAGIYSAALLYDKVNNTSNAATAGKYHLIPASETGAALVEGMLPEGDAASVAKIDAAVKSGVYTVVESVSYYTDEVGAGIYQQQPPLDMGFITAEGPGEYLFVVEHDVTATRWVLVRGMTLTRQEDVFGIVKIGNLPELMVIRGSTQSEVRAYTAGGKELLLDSNAIITYGSSNESVARVDNVGVVTAMGAGSAEITVSVTLGEITISSAKTIQVTDKIEYNFDQRYTAWTPPPEVLSKSPSTGNDCIVGIPYAFTGTADKDGNWAYYAKDKSEWSMETYNGVSNLSLTQYAPSFLRIWPNKKGQWVAFKVRIPAPGRYSAGLVYVRRKNSQANTASDIHLIPDWATGAATDGGSLPAADGVAVGKVSEAVTVRDFYKATVDYYYEAGATNEYFYPADPADLGVIDVHKPGEYLLVFESTRDGSVNYFVKQLVLENIAEPVLGLANVKLTAPSQIAVGTTVPAGLQGFMTDGSAAVLSGEGVSVIYTSTVPAVATVDKNSGLITAVAAGTTEIQAQVTMGGNTAASSATIVVGSSAAAIDVGNLIIDADNVESVPNAFDISVPYDTFGLVKSFELGTEVILTAKEPANREFLYWKNASSDRIIGTAREIKFKIGTSTNLTAVYRDTTQGKHLVEFVDKNGKVLRSELLDDQAVISETSAPVSVGFMFQNWDAQVPERATRSAMFIAQYEADPTPYSVTVIGGAISEQSGPLQYNTRVTVTADIANIPADEQFAYWTRNGEVVSYDKVYSFYVWDDTTVKAVSSKGSALEPSPAVLMDRAKMLADGSIAFSMERNLPDGYELLEAGILLARNPDGLTVYGSDVKKAVAQSNQPKGQFTARIDAAEAGTVWHARAYLIYKLPQSGFKIIYSNTVQS